MTEEKNLEQPLELEEPTAVIQDTMDTFLGAAHVDAVYGRAITAGASKIIPTAEIVSIAAFGYGSGYGISQEHEEEKNEGGGSGGGGGGRVLSRPVAVIVASPDGVRVEPVMDPTKIALAFFTTMGFMIGMIARMWRK
jgi:uncharacterized spore protein YtfJ